jgi:hypothetical protein
MDADSECSVVIKDRIFIADKVAKMNLLGRWNEARHAYGQTHDVGAFATSFGSILNDLIRSAMELIN